MLKSMRKNGVTLALFALGLVNLYSASGFRMEDGVTYGAFYQKQLLWGLLGSCCMVVVMCFDYRILRTLAWPAYWLTVILLAMVPLFGKTIYGAKRWLSLGFMSLQPAEIAKIRAQVGSGQVIGRPSRRARRSWRASRHPAMFFTSLTGRGSS